MVFSNKVYDRLLWVSQYFLPCFTAFWLALGKIWNFPYTVEIGATLSAIDVFLAGLLGVSKKNYKGDGTLHIDESDPEKDVYNLELNIPVEDLAGKQSVTFVVNKEAEQNGD